MQLTCVKCSRIMCIKIMKGFPWLLFKVLVMSICLFHNQQNKDIGFGKKNTQQRWSCYNSNIHTNPIFYICIPGLGCFRELCALCWMLHVRDKLSYSCRQYQKARENVEGKKVFTYTRIRKMNKHYLGNYCLIEGFIVFWQTFFWTHPDLSI